MSVCNDYCRIRGPKALPRRFPAEGKWQGLPQGVPPGAREEAPLMPPWQESARQLMVQGAPTSQQPSKPFPWTPAAPGLFTSF